MEKIANFNVNHLQNPTEIHLQNPTDIHLQNPEIHLQNPPNVVVISQAPINAYNLDHTGNDFSVLRVCFGALRSSQKASSIGFDVLGYGAPGSNNFSDTERERESLRGRL